MAHTLSNRKGELLSVWQFFFEVEGSLFNENEYDLSDEDVRIWCSLEIHKQKSATIGKKLLSKKKRQLLNKEKLQVEEEGKDKHQMRLDLYNC